MANKLRRHWTITIALISIMVTGMAYCLAANARSATGQDVRAALHFKLDVPGKATLFFTELSGLGTSTDIVEHKVIEGGREKTRKIPGRLHSTPVVLVAQETKNNDLWAWRQMVIDGNVQAARSNCSITMLDSEGNMTKNWDLMNAWPSALTFGCDASGKATVSITIVYEELSVDGVNSSKATPSATQPPSNPQAEGDL